MHKLLSFLASLPQDAPLGAFRWNEADGYIENTSTANDQLVCDLA